jgi:hypothetical protein
MVANVFANFGQVRPHLMNRLLQVITVNSILPVEHASGRVPSDRHDNTLGNTGFSCIGGKAVAGIMEDKTTLHPATVNYSCLCVGLLE